MKNRKIKSEQSAIENVKRFFKDTPNEDSVTLEEAFYGWGRTNPENINTHKAWLSNALYHLKYHGLVTPVYGLKDGRRKLLKIQLTLKGKKALGRIEGNFRVGEVQTKNNNENDSSIAEVMKIVAKLRKESPEYEITFDIKLKNQ